MIKEDRNGNKNILIKDLSISKRLKEALIRLGFKTLDELKDIEKNRLENLSGIGYKSLNELQELLTAHSIEIQRNSEVAQEVYQELDLKAYIEKEIPERDIFVIYNRVGLYGQEKTLEELGEIMNITRERVRQIEAHGFTMLRDAYSLGVLKDPLIEKFKSYGDRVSFYSEIDLDNKAYPKKCLIEILVHMFGDEYEVINNSKLGEESILSHKTSDLEKGLTDLLAVLSETESFKDLKGLSDKYKVPVHIIKGIKGIVLHNGNVALKNNKNLFYHGVTGKIYATLREEGCPMKIKEICKKANLTQNQVRGAIERVPEAVNVGLSTYALKEWGYIEGFIPDVAVYYLKEANQPLSLKQLTSLILKQRLVKKVSVYAGLSRDDRLVPLDNGYWALAKWGYENVRKNSYQHSEYEIDSSEALMDILNKNQEFMSLRQILEEITTKYGNKAPASHPTYYNAIQKLKETGDVVEMKQGRYCYYKSAVK